jgi:kynurenine formamidase
MKIVDLSLPIDESAPEPHPIAVKKWRHQGGGDRFGWRWAKSGGLKGRLKHLSGRERITHESFPDGLFLSLEWVTATGHVGTHIDAPYHFGPLSEGKEARKIEDIPLEWCFGDGVVLDVSHRRPAEFITKDDIDKALKEIKYEIKSGDIVLLRTGTDKLWGTKQYFFMFPGLGREATGYILDFGVKVIGIDTFSLDRPLKAMVTDYLRTKDNGYLWPAHFYGREKEYCHVERLTNLDKIPPYGCKVACFPIKVKGVGASWVRAVAFIDEKGG